MSRIALAARLARRELRRHPWRTALAVVIMALPVMAAQCAALMANANDASARVSEAMSIDGADLVTSPGVVADLVAAKRMPRPIRTETTFRLNDWLVTAHGELDGVTLIGHVPDSPRVVLQAGRLPRNDHEVLANADALRTTGASIGDRVELARGDVRPKVVGEAVVRDLADRPALVIGRSTPQSSWLERLLRGNAGVANVASDHPANMRGRTEDELSWFAPGVDGAAAFRSALGEVDGDVGGPSASTTAAIVAVVGGAIGILAVIASVAFTIGSRRRLRSLGMLASSGAAPADLAWTVVLEGLWCGAIAAIAATLVTYTAWLTVGRTPWVERVISASLADPPHPMMPAAMIGIALFCLLIGALAAALPARTVARIPVLTALGGRRPLPKLRTRLPLGGLITFAVGTGVITRGVLLANKGRPYGDAVYALAGLAVVFGGVAMAPAVVVAFGRLGRRTRGAAKLALRGLSRDRTRNAAVVGAAAVTLALPVVAMTQFARDAHQRDLTRPSYGSVSVYAQPAALPGLERQVKGVIGDDVVTARVLDVPGVEESPDSWYQTSTLVVVSPHDAETWFGDSKIASLLRSGEAVNPDVPADPALVNSTMKMPDVGGLYRDGTAPKVTTITLTADDLAEDPALASLVDAVNTGAVLVSSDVLAKGKLAEWERSIELLRRKPITEAEATKLRALEATGPTLAQVRNELATGQDLENLAMGEWSGQWLVPITTNRPGADHTLDLTLAAIGVATVFALVIVLVALALAAADGRDDERLYAALGGPPRLLRRKRTIEAGVLTFGAGLLGVGVGLIPTLAVLWAKRPAGGVDNTFPPHPPGYDALRVPTVELALLVVGVTAVVAAVVWLVQVIGGLRPRRDLILTDA